jgi:hydrogenase-4 component B
VSVGTLLLSGLMAISVGMGCGRRLPRLWLGLTIAGTGAIMTAALVVLGGAADWEWRSRFPVGGQEMHLRLDGISAMFLVLLGAVGGLGAIYAREYWSDGHQPESAPRGRLWWCAMILSMAFVLLSSNGLHFLIAWELFAISGFFLITLDRGRREVRAAGWLYLATSHAGTLCLFAFFALLAGRTGSWDLGPLRDHPDLAPLFWLALVGFAVKAGLFPLHIWLPSAHANAPSHVSALMSGVAIKMGLYGLIRFSGWLPMPSSAGWVVMGIGSVTALLGIAFAFAQNDLKRLLAYCSVENVGIIAIGIGGALLGAAHGQALWGRVLLAGALLHVWNHGLFKSLLFFGAGAVLHATGTREMSRLGGLWRSMPWTAALFGLGAAAICGLPPLNGFVSEWLIYLGLFDVATSRYSVAWVAIPAVLGLAMAGALALASFLKTGAVMFLGAARTQAADEAHECGWLMRGPMIALAVGCLAIGLVPFMFWPGVARAVGSWNPSWATAELPAPLFTLSKVHLALAGLFVGGALWLWRRAHAQGLRTALTWDCGYSNPTPRIQYTGGSFALMAAGWFAWILRPERVQHRPRGPFPERASRIDRMPETVLERVVEPAGQAVLHFAGEARQLQHGRLQSYLVYLAGGLFVLAVLVLVGEMK